MAEPTELNSGRIEPNMSIPMIVNVRFTSRNMSINLAISGPAYAKVITSEPYVVEWRRYLSTEKRHSTIVMLHLRM